MTNAEISRLSAPVVQAYRDMEDELLRLIGEQLGKDGRLTDTSKWRIRQLARAGEINREALQIIDSYAGGITGEVYDACIAAAESEIGTLDAAMLSLLSEKGTLTDDQKQMLGAFERQGSRELNITGAEVAESYAQALSKRCNLVNTVMGYSTRSSFVGAVNEVFGTSVSDREAQRQDVVSDLNTGAMAVVSGNESLHAAVRKTIHRMAQKGIPGFIDKAGREWSPEAYVKMDLRTTMANTARAAQDARCDEMGIFLIEVSSHMGARPKCAPYQGRIFSRNGTRGTTTDLDGGVIEYIPLSETSYGEPDGLFGINCGHQQYPFIPGLSVQRYYPYPEEQNAQRYKEMQTQRAMERDIRADKRECMMLQAAGDTEGLKEAAKQLSLDKDKYRDYSKAHGLGVHNENTQVFGYDKSKSMKTVWAGRKALTESASGAILKGGYNPDDIRKAITQKSNNFVIRDVNNPESLYGELVENIPPDPKFYDIKCHGASDSVKIFDSVIDENELARIILFRKDYDGRPIRLLACETGKGDDCIAQKLANLLGVDVQAPAEKIWASSSGTYRIGTTKRSNNGRMKDFLPAGKER